MILPVYNLIKKRRSTRLFLGKQIPPSHIKKILESGRWAPSGLNNQPWRFAVIKNKSLKDKLSRLTEYSPIIKKANCVIVVFLDKNSSYNYVKDVQAIGACIENMLLASLELGIRSCWIGEILNKEKRVNRLLDIARRYELMAAVALGYSSQKQKSNRISLDKLILKEIL